MIVVFFKTQPRDNIDAGEYQKAAERMYALVSKIPGFLSFKRYSSEDGDALEVARFESEEALEAWRTHPEHVEIQQRGRKEFYDRYWVQVCKSIREYEWRREPDTLR
jgi:heme-degrading monooxygenase HmoA